MFATPAVSYIRIEYSTQSIAVRIGIGQSSASQPKKSRGSDLELQVALRGGPIAHVLSINKLYNSENV